MAYLLSGRPFIYCPAGIELNSFYYNILKGAYVARSAKEIEIYVDQLIAKDDVMKGKRERNEPHSDHRVCPSRPF